MITLEDVARRAGVSLATASRVLNGSSRQVGASLRTRVEKAAAELGYRTNVAAQTLARGASNVIGLIVHDLVDPYFAAIADGAMRAADAEGNVVMVGTTRRDPEREIAYVATLNAQRARAVLVAGSRVGDAVITGRLRDELARYRATGGRVACVGQDLLGVDTVAPANHEGAAALAETLIGLGHRRFAVLAGPPHLVTAVDRRTGFCQAVSAAGLPDCQVVYGPFDRDGGYQAAATVGDDVTCVFAVNDVMAVGALAAFRDRGIVVPRDISVAGFDDIATLRDLVPALTTVRLPLADMGARAVGLALGDEAEPRVITVPGVVVLRSSVVALPG